MNQQERKKRSISTFNKIMIVYLISLSVVLSVLMGLEMAGLRLIHTEIPLTGGILLILSLIGWGIAAIVKRFKTMAMKVVVGVALALVTLVAGSGYLNKFQLNAMLVLPQQYTSITSPIDGSPVVIMRLPDLGPKGSDAEKRIFTRMDKRLAENPDTENEPALADMGFVYTAYPKVMNLFFRSKAECDGQIYWGVESKATLMFDWIDENTLRLYLENPEPGDSGELTLKLR